MDINLVIAIAGISGTVVGTIISAVGTYIVQSRVSERERGWAAESENKRVQSERETEQRRIRRELLSNRLSVVEEAATLMMFLIGLELDTMMGIPVFSEREIIHEKRKRLEEIYAEARTAVQAAGSSDLVQSFGTLSSTFWECENAGQVIIEDYETVSHAYAEVIKVIDELLI